MIKKKDLSQEDKKVWENFTKHPSNIYDKEQDNQKDSSRKDRLKYDLHGFTLENANKKVSAILAFASKIVKDLLNRLGQLRTKLRLNRDQHKAIVAEMNNLLDAITQMEKEYLETNFAS